MADWRLSRTGWRARLSIGQWDLVLANLTGGMLRSSAARIHRVSFRPVGS